MSQTVLAGRYEIRSLIGRGGMAEVHLGYDTRLSRLVAVKMLRLDLAKDSIFQKRFRREAQSAASLNHPNIVAVYDTGEYTVQSADGSSVAVPYIIMEYVEGHTVRDLLADGAPVPIDEAVEIMSGVLSALEYSHAQGLVHRDIKPGNVMLTNSGKVKVMDFGIARAIADSSATMTQTDAVVGTAQYLSPEQARGEQVDSRSDLYSAGCLLFELLTGRPPFRGDSAVSVAYQHVSELPPVPSSIAPDIPESLDRVVLKAMAKRREDRYTSAAEMMRDLQAAVHGGSVFAPAANSWAPPAPTQSLPAVDALAPTTATTATAVQTLEQSRQLQEQREKERRAKKRRAVILWTLLILAILTAATAIGVILYSNSHDSGSSSNEQKVIPTNLIGMSPAEARAELEKLGLTMIQGKDVASDTIEKGKIAEVVPGVGQRVPAGSKVEIHVSTGKPQVVIPDLANLSQDQARQALQEAGLEVGNIEVKDAANVPKDAVIETNPKAGTKVDAGTAITLIVSSGNVVIPNDLVGKPQDQVLNTLSDLGLSTTTVTQESSSAKEGTVISVNPTGRVPQNTRVTVTVATKPPTPQPPTQPNDNNSPDPSNPPVGGNNGNNSTGPGGNNTGEGGAGGN